MFSPPSQNFPTGLVDPCDGVTAATAGTLGEVCRSFVGVAANIAQNGSFTLNQADLQGISGFDRGNPLLSEEKGDSFIARLVINPRSIEALRNFGFTASYSNIRVKDAIVSTPRQFILDQCFERGEQSFCDFIKRRPAAEGSNSAGSLDEIDSAVTNSGGLKAEGLDFTATYTQEVFSGRLNLSLSYTHLLDGFLIPLPGSDKDFFAGEIGAAKDKFLVSANYSINKMDFTLRGTFIGESSLDDQFLATFDLERNDPRARIPAEFYADAQIRYRASDAFEFYAGVDNLLGNDPTVIPSGLPGNTTGAETDAGTYDAIGRRFYFGTKLRF